MIFHIGYILSLLYETINRRTKYEFPIRNNVKKQDFPT
jgi:hypothetical protein